MHLMLCAFRLMETARAARVTQQPPRPARRRAARAQVTRPAQPVRLVDVTAGHVRRSPAAPGGRADREYRVRWLVNGHWRNQYYPSRDAHRPRWIDGYVKGPAGAPLKISETVHIFRQRPGTPQETADHVDDRAAGPGL